jgi:hypothetical protein
MVSGLVVGCDVRPGDAVVCSAAVVDGTPIAGDEVACAASEGEHGGFRLDVSQWPELEPVDHTYCAGISVHVDAPCRVTAVSVVGEESSVALRCGDKGRQHVVRIMSDVAWLRLPVCQGDSVRFRYARENNGCGYGGYNLAFVVRDEDDRLLAAHTDGSRTTWLEPLTVDFLGTIGCEAQIDGCASWERAGLMLGEQGGGPGFLVPDATRRIVELSSRYAVRSSVVREELCEYDGEGGGGQELDLALIDP